jgi:hypothetical protein
MCDGHGLLWFASIHPRLPKHRSPRRSAFAFVVTTAFHHSTEPVPTGIANGSCGA